MSSRGKSSKRRGSQRSSSSRNSQSRGGHESDGIGDYVAPSQHHHHHHHQTRRRATSLDQDLAARDDNDNDDDDSTSSVDVGGHAAHHAHHHHHTQFVTQPPRPRQGLTGKISTLFRRESSRERSVSNGREQGSIHSGTSSGQQQQQRRRRSSSMDRPIDNTGGNSTTAAAAAASNRRRSLSKDGILSTNSAGAPLLAAASSSSMAVAASSSAPAPPPPNAAGALGMAAAQQQPDHHQVQMIRTEQIGPGGHVVGAAPSSTSSKKSRRNLSNSISSAAGFMGSGVRVKKIVGIRSKGGSNSSNRNNNRGQQQQQIHHMAASSSQSPGDDTSDCVSIASTSSRQSKRIFYSSHNDDDSDDSYESRMSRISRGNSRRSNKSPMKTRSGGSMGDIGETNSTISGHASEDYTEDGHGHDHDRDHDDVNDSREHHRGGGYSGSMTSGSGEQTGATNTKTIVRYRGFSTSIKSLFLDETVVCASMGCFGLILSNRTEYLLQLRNDRRGVLSPRKTTSQDRKKLPSRIVAYGLLVTIILMFSTFVVWGFGTGSAGLGGGMYGGYHDYDSNSNNQDQSQQQWDDYLNNNNNNNYNNDDGGYNAANDDGGGYNQQQNQYNYNNNAAANGDDKYYWWKNYNNNDDGAANNDGYNYNNNNNGDDGGQAANNYNYNQNQYNYNQNQNADDDAAAANGDDGNAAANDDAAANNYNNYNQNQQYNYNQNQNNAAGDDAAAANGDDAYQAAGGDDYYAAADDGDDYYKADDGGRYRNRRRNNRRVVQRQHHRHGRVSDAHKRRRRQSHPQEQQEISPLGAMEVSHPLHGIFKLRDCQENVWDPIIDFVRDEWNRPESSFELESSNTNGQDRRRVEDSQQQSYNTNNNNSNEDVRRDRNLASNIRIAILFAFLLFLGVLGRRRRMRTRFYLVRARAQEDHLYYASADVVDARRVNFEDTREDQYEGACSHTLCGCYPVDEVIEQAVEAEEEVEVTDNGIFKRKRKPHNEDFVARTFNCLLAVCCGWCCKCWFQCLSICALAQEAREIRLLVPPRYQRIDYITHQPFHEYQKEVNDLRRGWLGKTRKKAGFRPHYMALSRLSRYIVITFVAVFVILLITLIFNPRAAFSWQDAVVVSATFVQAFLVLFIVHWIFHKSDLSLDAVIKMFAGGFIIAVPAAFFFESLLYNIVLCFAWIFYEFCAMLGGEPFVSWVFEHWRAIWFLGELFNAYVVAAVTEELCKYYTFRAIEHPDLVFLTGLNRNVQDEDAVDGGLVKYPFASHQVQKFNRTGDSSFDNQSVHSHRSSSSEKRGGSRSSKSSKLIERTGTRDDEFEEDENDVRTYRQKAMAITTGMISVAVGLACAENFLYVFVLGGAQWSDASEDYERDMLEQWIILFFRSIFPIHALSAALQSINMIRKFVEVEDQNGHRIGVGRIILPAVILHGSFDAILMGINVYQETAWERYMMDQAENQGNADAGDEAPYNTLVVNLVAWIGITAVMFAGLGWYYRENRHQRLRLKILEEKEKARTAEEDAAWSAAAMQNELV